MSGLAAARFPGPRGAAIALLSAVLDPILHLFELATIALGLGMVAVIFMQVILRYVFNTAFFGAEELARYLFSWFIFLSATVGLDKGIHFAVDTCVRLLPRRAQALLVILVHLLCMAVLAILLVKGINLTLRNWAQVSPAMQIPVSWPYAAIPTGAGVMILVLLRRMLRGEAASANPDGDA